MATKKYIVQDGDTLESIAKQYNIAADRIALENSLNLSDTLAAGREIAIPTGYQSADVSSAASTADALKIIEAARPGYSASDALLEAERLLASWQENKPTDYVSSYADKIADLLGQLESRPSFSYDPAADPLYGLYRDHYMRDGRLAMLDAEANAAALSGGYANSYAATAGNQAYQMHLGQLSALLPQLYENAYDRWQREGQALADRLAQYGNLEQSDYDRWRDGVEDYYEDLTYYYNRYSDMSRAEYDAYMDDLDAWQADRDYWYQRLMDEQAQANWKAEFDLAVQKASSSGGGGGGGRSGGGGSTSSKSSNYNTFLNGLKETVRIQLNMGRSKSSIYSTINNQVNEFLSNDFITKSEATQMRAVAQSYYQTQYAKKRG